MSKKVTDDKNDSAIKKPETNQSKAHMIALEPRFMFDAAGMVTAVDSMSDGIADISLSEPSSHTEVISDQPSELVELFSDYSTPGSSTSSSREIAFVDSTIAGAENWLQQINANAEIVYPLR